MEAKLVVVGGDAKTTEINLQLPTIIGRGRGAAVTLPHPLVSRQHCELFEAEGRLMVRDLGSLNGTFVGNEPVTEAVLPPGELLTVGAVTFRAIYGELLEKEKRERAEPQPGPQKRPDPATRTTRDQGAETLDDSRLGAEPSKDRAADPSEETRPGRRKPLPPQSLRQAPTVCAPDATPCLPKIEAVVSTQRPPDDVAAMDEAALVEDGEIVAEAVEIVDLDEVIVVEELEALDKGPSNGKSPMRNASNPTPLNGSALGDTAASGADDDKLPTFFRNPK